LGEAGETLFQYVIIATTSSMAPETKTYEKQITNLDLGWVPTPLTTGEITRWKREEGDRSGGARGRGEKTPRKEQFLHVGEFPLLPMVFICSYNRV
jgi:hypothetical protein